MREHDEDRSVYSMTTVGLEGETRSEGQLRMKQQDFAEFFQRPASMDLPRLADVRFCAW